MSKPVHRLASYGISVARRSTTFTASRPPRSDRSLSWLAVHPRKLQQNPSIRPRFPQPDSVSAVEWTNKGATSLVCVIPMDMGDYANGGDKLFIKNIAFAPQTWEPVRPAISSVDTEEKELVGEGKEQMIVEDQGMLKDEEQKERKEIGSM